MTSNPMRQTNLTIYITNCLKNKNKKQIYCRKLEVTQIVTSLTIKYTANNTWFHNILQEKNSWQVHFLQCIILAMNPLVYTFIYL